MEEFDDIEVWSSKEKNSDATTSVGAEPKSKKGLLLGLLALLFVAAGGAALYAFVLNSDSDSTSASDEDEKAENKDSSDKDSSDDLENTNLRDKDPAAPSQNVDIAQLVDSAADTSALEEKVDKSGAWVIAKEGMFSMELKGRVATEEQKATLEETLASFYLGHFRTDIEVDSSVDAAYIDATPLIIVHNSSLLSNGGFALDKNGLFYEGDFYDQEDFDIYNTIGRDPHKEQLENLGITVAEPDLSVEPIISSSLNVLRKDDKVVLTGAGPTQETIDVIYNAALSSYPAEEIVNEMKIDPTTAGGYGIPQMEVVIPVYSALEEYEFGLGNDQFYSNVESGATFETGSATLTGKGLEFVTSFAALTSQLQLQHEFIGHTDSAGSDITNLELSKQRAETVANIFREAGVPEEDIVVTGLGETKPVASNETPEGKAKNRRVKIKLGSVTAAAQADTQ